MADGFAEAALTGYQACTSLLRPVVPLLLSMRAARGKEDRARLAERYGTASLPRPDGRVVWVHAASVGETNAALPLIERLVSAGFSVLFTTTTVTSARIAATRLPAGAIHQFGPLDVPAFVDRFLAHWKPGLVLFVESEIWPATMRRLELAGVPLVVVNGRMSDRAYRRWQTLGPMSRVVFRKLALVLARTDEDAARYRALGAGAVAVSGNLKFDALPLVAEEGELAALRAAIGSRPVWLAASTHEGEEEAVAAAHRALRANHPDLLTVVVPRHPARGDKVRAVLASAGFTVAQRSRGEPLTAGTDVYLGDTMDEMGLFLRLAPVCFLGGSLAVIGGHNPIEPIRLHVPVVHGPHVASFADLYRVIDAAVPAARIAEPSALANAVAPLLDQRSERARWVQEQAAALAPLSGGLDATMAALAPYLDPEFSTS